MPQVFQYKVYLPSIADYVRVSELKNHEHLNIIKYNKNDDPAGLSSYLESLIESKIEDKTITLHRIDKYCIILTMIMLCIDPMITLQATCEETEEQYELVIDVGDVLNIISNVKYINHVENINNMVIHFEYPRELYVSQSEPINFIAAISIDDTKYDLNGYTKQDFESILNNLPGSSFTKIANKIKDIKTSLNNVDVLTFESPYAEKPTTTKLGVDLVENDLFEFIRILFGQDLNGYYEMQFAMMSNYHFPPGYYSGCTPIEVKIFYSYMKQDVENQKKQMEDHKKQNQSPAERVSG